MPYDIVYAPRALEDLDDIWNYLGVGRDNVKAASSAVSAILKRIDLLSDFPESGTPLNARCIIHTNYRFVMSGNYLVFYRIANKCVYIDRILDGRSDYLGRLLGLDGSATDLYA